MSEELVTEQTAIETGNDQKLDELVEQRVSLLKKQLYANLETKERKAREAEEKARELTERLKSLEDEKKERELAELSITDRLQRQLEEVTKRAEDAMRLAQAKDAEAQEIRRVAELTRFRDNAVRDSDLDPDLAELVTGNDESEVLKSLDRAKLKQAKLVEKFGGGARVAAPAVPPITNPATPGIPTMIDIPDIRGANTREKLDEYKRRMGLIK